MLRGMALQRHDSSPDGLVPSGEAGSQVAGEPWLQTGQARPRALVSRLCGVACELVRSRRGCYGAWHFSGLRVDYGRWPKIELLFPRSMGDAHGYVDGGLWPRGDVGRGRVL